MLYVGNVPLFELMRGGVGMPHSKSMATRVLGRVRTARDKQVTGPGWRCECESAKGTFLIEAAIPCCVAARKNACDVVMRFDVPGRRHSG